jgi:hypothetical protein
VCQDPDHFCNGSYCGSWKEHRKIQWQVQKDTEDFALLRREWNWWERVQIAGLLAFLVLMGVCGGTAFLMGN